MWGGLLLKGFIPEELYQFVEFFHGRAVELLSVDLTADFAASLKQDCVAYLCENDKIGFDEFDVSHGHLPLSFLYPYCIMRQKICQEFFLFLIGFLQGYATD
jgi:phosphosulfolactate synthase (CoM biosynthesis protein A)